MVEIAKKEQTEKIKSQSHRELWNSGVLKVPFLKILFPSQKFGTVFLVYSRAYC